MTATVRRVDDNEFFTWLDLYAGYGEFYETPLTDEKALLVWSWLTDSSPELTAYFAVNEAGEPIGLAHVREFARPLDGSRGLYLDDLFVSPDARGEGAATALLESLRDRARAEGFSVVRWITAKDNETARRVYDRVAEKTKWVTYDLVP
ncbi:GNAT family N-acetyltransferase [Leifsonia poae]|uniref:N-acetyltransferase n=1 Tax=Leifsonia poae TaxID=110933 RepID=A0A9W6HDS1_9MICO|nr:GNAT family N-acetyltransferase [Leifsonia poae]GLJ77903.1 N-acetyltransferase [Leifsonia poae]